MKILYIINNLTKGGAETLLINFLNKAVKIPDIEVELLVLTNNIHITNLSLLNSVNIKTHILSNDGLYNPFKMILLLKKFFKGRSYSSIHVHLFPAMYWIAIIHWIGILKCPIIFTEHSNKNNRIGKEKFKWIERKIYEQYHMIICVSQSVMQTLQNWVVPSSKMIVINNGIDLNAAVELIDLKKELNIESNSLLILMAARFEPNKDHITLLKAVKSLQNIHIKVLLAGEGRTQKAVKSYVIENGLAKQCFFLGVRNDIRSVMKSVDLNVLSTEYEGLSGVTIESLAANKPFIGTDVPGVRELVGDNYGLFKYKDVECLAEKIKSLLFEAEKINKNTTLNFIKVKEFDINFMLKEHLHLYSKISF
jgi:glycosyltransferase involved in cell wall biosynthesis